MRRGGRLSTRGTGGKVVGKGGYYGGGGNTKRDGGCMILTMI